MANTQYSIMRTMMMSTEVFLQPIISTNHHLWGFKEKQLDMLLFSVKFIEEGLWNKSAERQPSVLPLHDKADESISQERASKLCQWKTNNFSWRPKEGNQSSWWCLISRQLAAVWRRSSGVSTSPYMGPPPLRHWRPIMRLGIYKRELATDR